MEVSKLYKKRASPLEGLREYLILISPPSIIKNDVWKFKNEFLNRFGNATYVHSQAHISLSNFLIESTPERTLFNELSHFVKHWKSFEVRTLGFERFENSNTIFLAVTEPKIVNLQKHMVEVLRKRAKIGNRFTRKLEKPHITIAGKIPDYQFNQSWNYFKKIFYTENFVVDSITVLRRNHSLRELKYAIAFEINLME